jgi:hypothetical protein
MQSNASILNEDKMAKVLTEIHIVEASFTPMQLMGDSAMQYAVDHYTAVFESNNTNGEQFRESLQFYSRHPRQLDKIYERVIENLNKQQIEANNKK